MEYTSIQRDLWINCRSLLLKAIDVMDRAYHVGKYKQAEPVAVQPSDSIATAVIVEAKEANSDKLPSV